jgi:hypothetical protein
VLGSSLGPQGRRGFGNLKGKTQVLETEWWKPMSDDGNSRDTYGEYFSLNENPHGVILAFSSRWKTTH